MSQTPKIHRHHAKARLYVPPAYPSNLVELLIPPPEFLLQDGISFLQLIQTFRRDHR
jgi:hypothetical protein